jgi:hypothetical protein
MQIALFYRQKTLITVLLYLIGNIFRVKETRNDLFYTTPSILHSITYYRKEKYNFSGYFSIKLLPF